WRYRDLIGLFVWRDFVSTYKQTVLGPAWHVIQPLLTTLMFTVIFSRVVGLSTDGIPPFLFYFVGIVAWNYFSANLLKTSATFLGSAHLLGKVYFHRLAVPISITISSLITFGIQLSIFLVCLAWHWFRSGSVHWNGWLLASPVFFVMLGGYSLGCGIIVS